VFVRIKDPESFNEAFALEDPWFETYFFARDLGPRNRLLHLSNPGLRTLTWDGSRLAPADFP
jgi:hypothetical protein